jgi:hypothetical protein
MLGIVLSGIMLGDIVVDVATPLVLVYVFWSIQLVFNFAL